MCRKGYMREEGVVGRGGENGGGEIQTPLHDHFVKFGQCYVAYCAGP